MIAKDAYTFNGNFEPDLLYSALYNKIPCKYEYAVDDDYELESSEINIDKIRHLFENIGVIHCYQEDYLRNASEVAKTSSEEDYWGIMPRRSYSKYIVFEADGMVIHVNRAKVSIRYPQEMPLDEVIKLAKDIFESFPKKEPESKAGKVSLIKVSQGDYYTSEKEVKPKTVNIAENYNDDFLPIDEDITKFLNDRSSGLILLYGEPGTGKTSYIRHLISAVPKEYIIVPNSVAQRLGDPDLTTFITDHTDSVFILEDCEQLLEDREENQFNNAIATILNMADGLLSDIVNIKFICTFNAPINKIDPALLRKGRCIAKYKFDKLDMFKVQALNDKYNLGHISIRSMTLAEVYNPDKIDYTEEVKKPKIGF
jgi:hypothetical protein